MGEGKNAMKKKIAIKIEYDGTKFYGWQYQPNRKTVQGEIEKALNIIFKRRIALYGAGRTDSGVHAKGQVAHFIIPHNVDINKLKSSLNALIGPYIAISDIKEVDSKFHARFSAIYRIYSYWFIRDASKHPLYIERAYNPKVVIEPEIFMEYFYPLIGEHNFASFSAKEKVSKNTIRRIDKIWYNEEDVIIKIYIKANSFLRNMVRIIMGTAIQCYRKGEPPSIMEEILKKQDRELAGPTAPPYALYLEKIGYENDPFGNNKSL